MAEALFVALKKDLIALITVLTAQNYVPRTIIGKDHERTCQATTVGNDKAKSCPKIRKIHGDDQEEMWWKKVSVTYGPLYRHLDTLKEAKKEAWNHVVQNSNDEGGVRETTRRFVEAMKRIEHVSRALYGDGGAGETAEDLEDPIAARKRAEHETRGLKGDGSGISTVKDVEDPIASLTSDEFIWIMILDGCFLLQVVFLVLGGSKQLGHPEDDKIFGKPGNDKELIRAAVSSMFIIGNQIPILVLHELMKQSFFKRVFNQGIWQQPLDLQRSVLFQLLLVPMIDVRGGAKFIPTNLMQTYNLPVKSSHISNNRFVRFVKLVDESLTSEGFMKALVQTTPLGIWLKWKTSSQKAHDLLHGLWLLMTGLADLKEDDDCNDGNENEHLNGGSNPYYDVVPPTVRSATELEKAGIVIRYKKGTNVGGISLEKIMFNAFLILPRIAIDSEMETLFCSLIQYEAIQGLCESRRKFCSYLQLMQELIRTPEDARLLASNGVIAVDPDQEGKLPELFKGLPIPRAKTTGSLRKVRDELNSRTHLSSTFKKLRNVLSIVIMLSIIQTVYTVLTFHLRK